MDIPFVLKFVLRTLMIGGNQPISGAIARLHSDALDGDWKKAHETLPFTIEEGVECCSMPLYQSYDDPQFDLKTAKEGEKADVDVYPGQIVGFAAKLFPHDIDPDVISPTRTGKLNYGQSRVRECGNVLSYYPSKIVQEMWFVGKTNNPDLLEKYAYQLNAIGKKHNVGFGALDTSKTQVYIDQGQTNGIVDSKGTPLRPIPITANIAVNKDSIIADVGYKPAFWDINNRCACYIPSRDQQIKTFTQIDKEFL